QHHPPDELVEVAQRGVHRKRLGHFYSALLRVTRLPCPAPRSRRTAEPGLLVGSHTTPSAISVTYSGTVTAPVSVDTDTLSPSASPASAAVAGETRAA